MPRKYFRHPQVICPYWLVVPKAHHKYIYFFEVSGHLTHKNKSQKPNDRSARVFIYCGVFVTERRASVIKQT